MVRWSSGVAVLPLLLPASGGVLGTNDAVDAVLWLLSDAYRPGGGRDGA